MRRLPIPMTTFSIKWVEIPDDAVIKFGCGENVLVTDDPSKERHNIFAWTEENEHRVLSEWMRLNDEHRRMAIEKVTSKTEK